MSEFRILIVDDVESNRLLLRTILNREGHTVLEAQNGVEALEIFRRGDVDLALLDVMMPDMDGIEVCREIRKTHAETEFPVLFITARVEDKDLADGLAAGANDYIAKPVNAKILLARLNAVLRLIRTTRALQASYAHLGQRKRMETVGTFAAGVAHNFNNILGTVLGSAELIKRANDKPEQREKAVELIIRAAKRGAELTESLLTFTQAPRNGRCDKPADAARAALMMLPLVTKASVTFIVEIDAALPAIGMPTPHLSQIFAELVKNSIDAIEAEGQVTIRGTLNEGARTVSFRIEDTGRGMPQAAADHLFEPFYSTKNLDSLMGIALDGSGLGLTSVYNMIQNVGGEIKVVESSTSGTVIEFTLPVADRAGDILERLLQ